MTTIFVAIKKKKKKKEVYLGAPLLPPNFQSFYI